MRLKGNSVRLAELRPQMAFACQVIEYVYERYAQWTQIDSKELVVTSANDSKHGKASLHYQGCALDFRTNNIANPKEVTSEIKFRLGGDFDVIFEGEGTPNQHIHVEYDPK